MTRRIFEVDMTILKPVLMTHGFGEEYIDTVLEPYFWNYFETADHLDNITGSSIYALLVKNVGKSAAASISNKFDEVRHELF